VGKLRVDLPPEVPGEEARLMLMVKLYHMIDIVSPLEVPDVQE